MLTQEWRKRIEENMESYVSGLAGSMWIDAGTGSPATVTDTDYNLWRPGSLARKTPLTYELNTTDNRLTQEFWVSSTEWNNIRDEYYHPGSDDRESEFGSGASSSMSFKTWHDCISKRASFKLKYTAGASGNVTFTLQADDGGSPSGAYASGVISSFDDTSTAWYTGSWNTNPTLQSGVTYWLTLKADDAATGAYAWIGDISGTYANGGESGAVADLGFEVWQDRITEMMIFPGSTTGSGLMHRKYDTPIQKNDTVELQFTEFWEYEVNINV